MDERTARVYDKLMYPIEKLGLERKRMELLLNVSGVTLEVGAGTGANLPHYPYKNITHLTLLDTNIPSKVRLFNFPKATRVRFIEGKAERLPFDRNTFNSVVFTLVFCSVDNPEQGLREIYRVLKPGGRIFFIEHVLPKKRALQKTAQLINRGWQKTMQGCSLTRETLITMQEVGFRPKSYQFFWQDFFISGVAVK